MSENIRLGDVVIAVKRKAVKNLHLSVHPPGGRVTLVAPTDTRLEVAIIDALSASSTMSKRALVPAELTVALKAVLLGGGRL